MAPARATDGVQGVHLLSIKQSHVFCWTHSFGTWSTAF
jgi:hypothetical protein